MEKIRSFLVPELELNSKEQGDSNTGNIASIIWKMKPQNKYMFLQTEESSSLILELCICSALTDTFWKGRSCWVLYMEEVSDSYNWITGRTEGCSESCLCRWWQTPSVSPHMPFCYMQLASPGPKSFRVSIPELYQHTGCLPVFSWVPLPF